MNKVVSRIVAPLPYLLVFLSSISQPSDPDLGWHLKYGEYFFQHGYPLRENVFSTMMPNFHWANTSWFTDIVTYALYHSFGFLGLSLGAAAVVTLTFFFFAQAARLTIWDKTFLFPLALYFINPVNIVSFRGQQLSLLFTGILFFILSQAVKNTTVFLGKVKVELFLIPLFFIWVNVHGQFILGVALFFIWILARLVTVYFFAERRKESLLQEIRRWSVIFLLSSLATLINPFGIRIWLVSFRHFGDPNLKYIAEYLPFYDQSSLWINLVVALSLIIIGFVFHFFSDNAQEQIPYAVIALVLFALTFTVRRYAWTLYYIIFPLLTPIVAIYAPSKKWSYITSGIFLAGMIGFVLFSNMPLKYDKMDWNSYCNQSVDCSPKSAEYLERHMYKGKLLTFYDWGGWLIWNYPKIKPSIDGRMHLWRDEKGYSAFDEYYPLEQNWKDIDKSSYDAVFMSPKKPLYDRLVALAKTGKWKIVYQDSKAGIFVRNSKTHTWNP